MIWCASPVRSTGSCSPARTSVLVRSRWNALDTLHWYVRADVRSTLDVERWPVRLAFSPGFRFAKS